MSKRYIVLVVMVGLVVVVLAAPGYGAAKKKHQCTGTYRSANVEREGTREVYVGLFDFKCDSGKTKHGVEETHNTITGAGPGPEVQAKGETTHYFEGGTLKFGVSYKVTVQPDGSLALAAEFKVTGGTGVFKGATGSGTITGAGPLSLLTLESKGTIAY